MFTWSQVVVDDTFSVCGFSVVVVVSRNGLRFGHIAGLNG